MYNPAFWEVQFDQADLERFSNESNIWFETKEDQEDRYQRENMVNDLANKIYGILPEFLTQRQYEVVILYFLQRKTQQEISAIMGISRRVVSQHLFGIYRNGKHIGGAVNKLRKLSALRGVDLNSRNPGIHSQRDQRPSPILY